MCRVEKQLPGNPYWNMLLREGNQILGFVSIGTKVGDDLNDNRFRVTKRRISGSQLCLLVWIILFDRRWNRYLGEIDMYVVPRCCFLCAIDIFTRSDVRRMRIVHQPNNLNYISFANGAAAHSTKPTGGQN